MGLLTDILMELFDRPVVPTHVWVESWGCENNGIIEKVHLKFCRVLLNVKNRTPRCMMMIGELGRVL